VRQCAHVFWKDLYSPLASTHFKLSSFLCLLGPSFQVTCFYSGPGNVVGVATGYRLDDLGIESGWGRDFPRPSRPAHPASCTMGTGSFLGVKSGQGMTLTSHPLLVPWSRKGRAIPLLPLWAIQPLQSLSACKRVHFTVYFTWFHNV
jgi:hypothetical protein